MDEKMSAYIDDLLCEEIDRRRNAAFQAVDDAATTDSPIDERALLEAVRAYREARKRREAFVEWDEHEGLCEELNTSPDEVTGG